MSEPAGPTLRSRGQPFRSLVVVPRSHCDGTYERIAQGLSTTEKISVKDPAISSRAVQLDLRPDLLQPAHESVIVVWDSRLVHQGHSHNPHKPGWNPPVFRPPFFQWDAETEWKHYLATQGFVAIANVLSAEEVAFALAKLQRDLSHFAPLSELDAVTKAHLPPQKNGNDLRMDRGLCHGEFAWYLRCRPRITRTFEAMFDLSPGAPMVGSTDVVALAPPGYSSRLAQSRQWLHIDYCPPGKRIYQATVQLFPQGANQGARWERIAMMICKAPLQWSSLEAQKAILACSVTGLPSRATAGVTLGKTHKEKPSERSKPRLLPELTCAPRCLSSAAKAIPPICRKSVDDLVRSCDFEVLRGLLPREVSEYIVPRNASEGAASAAPAAAAAAGPVGAWARGAFTTLKTPGKRKRDSVEPEERIDLTPSDPEEEEEEEESDPVVSRVLQGLLSKPISPSIPSISSSRFLPRVDLGPSGIREPVPAASPQFGRNVRRRGQERVAL